MLRTYLLMAALTALFLGGGYLLGGTTGLVIAFVVALGMNFFSYWNADKIVLRLYGAREVGPTEAPKLYTIVTNLAKRANLPMPKVYIIDSPQPNAFATGRNPNHAAVAATRGLLERLSPEEVAGVMAHELAHVMNRDTLIMTITATLAGALGMLANFAIFFRGGRDNPLGFIGVIAMMILAPLAAMLVQFAISRTREFDADEKGAQIAGNPLWLASALEKLQTYSRHIDNQKAENNPATAHMFIINPLHAHSIDGLFSTHPSTEKRVSRLRAMAGAMERDYNGPSFDGSKKGAALLGQKESFKGPWG